MHFNNMEKPKKIECKLYILKKGIYGDDFEKIIDDIILICGEGKGKDLCIVKKEGNFYILPSKFQQARFFNIVIRKLRIHFPEIKTKKEVHKLGYIEFDRNKLISVEYESNFKYSKHYKPFFKIGRFAGINIEDVKDINYLEYCLKRFEYSIEDKVSIQNQIKSLKYA